MSWSSMEVWILSKCKFWVWTYQSYSVIKSHSMLTLPGDEIPSDQVPRNGLGWRMGGSSICQFHLLEQPQHLGTNKACVLTLSFVWQTRPGKGVKRELRAS
jgi:hypothetical protein